MTTLACEEGVDAHSAISMPTVLLECRRKAESTHPLNPVLWRGESCRADYEALVREVQQQDVGLMTIKTVSRRNSPTGTAPLHTTWYEPYTDQARITAALSWVLDHREVTGFATGGDVSFLAMLIHAEQNRISVTEAEETLAADDGYSSPFIAMPF